MVVGAEQRSCGGWVQWWERGVKFIPLDIILMYNSLWREGVLLPGRIVLHFFFILFLSFCAHQNSSSGDGAKNGGLSIQVESCFRGLDGG